MRHQNFEPVQLKGPMVFLALLLSVFATELSVMVLLAPLLPRLNLVATALLDACLVVGIIAAPVWFFFFRPVPEEDSSTGETQACSAILLLQALTGVFMVEYLVMLLLPSLLPACDPRTIALTDALVTSLSTGFILWWFLFRRKMRRRSVPLMDTPLRLYILLLATFFLSDLLQEVILPLLGTADFLTRGKVANAFLTTLCGAPLLWLLVVQPLKRAARSEKSRVAAMHAQVIDAIVAIDTHAVIRSFNPAAERIFGYGAAEMIGRPAALLFEEGQKGLDSLSDDAASQGEQPPVMFSEISCRRRDGLALIMGVSISEVVLEQQRPEFLLIMRDITSRKRMVEALGESEMRFREIFHQSEDAILFFKPGGDVIIDANANAERIFGYCKAELQQGGLQLIIEPEGLPLLDRAISGISEGRTAQQDFLCRRKDREQIIVSLRGKIMLLQGIPITYCTFRDVTDRVRMEERTRDIQAKLIQTNKMTALGLMVSGVAHEINNPNNFIMANCELLARISEDSLKALREYSQERKDTGEFYIAGIPFSEVDQHARRLTDGIADGSRRVNDIVKKLKAFARQERNQVKSSVDVNEVARSAASLLHHELMRFTENFHLELADSIPPIKGHGQQLGQVIINLLMNACQALPDRSSGIWLTTQCDAKEGLVTIAVRDEGRGMLREDSLRIMEPFFTTRLDSGGTGLGLSISESIVKEHGGRLEFSSEPGQGTTFRVAIPVSGKVRRKAPNPSPELRLERGGL